MERTMRIRTAGPDAPRGSVVTGSGGGRRPDGSARVAGAVQLLGRMRMPRRLSSRPRERVRDDHEARSPTSAVDPFETQVAAAREWFAQPRFDGIVRLHTAREVAAQQGTIQPDYTVARMAAEGFYARLRELFAEGRQITTFGPYSPGQAVVMKRLGLEGIYLGGWATSAKGSSDGGSRSGPCELPPRPGSR